MNSSDSIVTRCVSQALLIVLLLVASLVGSIFVGVVVGLPNAVKPAALTHFLIAAPFAVCIGLPAFILMRRFGLHHSILAVVFVAISIASVPLLVLLIPDIALYGFEFFLIDKPTLLYTLSVIVSAAIGGVVFAMGSRWLSH